MTDRNPTPQHMVLTAGGGQSYYGDGQPHICGEKVDVQWGNTAPGFATRCHTVGTFICRDCWYKFKQFTPDELYRLKGTQQ